MTHIHPSLLDTLISECSENFLIEPNNPFNTYFNVYSSPLLIPDFEFQFDIYVGKNVFYIKQSAEFISDLFATNTLFIVDKTAYHSLLEFFDSSINPDNVVFFDETSSPEFLDSLISRVSAYSFFVALGSGFLHDICKYIQHVSSVQCLLIPTALSTHVYASNFIHAHKILQSYGLRKSIKSEIQFISILLGDFLDITHSRFPRLLSSGIADVYALKTATIEWQFGPQYRSTNAHRLAVYLSHKAISLLLSYSSSKSLLDLVLSQVVLNLITEVVGSPPASGTEHLYANTIEHHFDTTDYHGELVAKGILLQVSILDIFPTVDILSEMKSLNILPEKPIHLHHLDQKTISNMLDLSILKNRFTILSVIP